MKTLIAALVASTVSFGAFAQASAPAKTMPMKAPAASTSSMAAASTPMKAKKAKKMKKAASAA